MGKTIRRKFTTEFKAKLASDALKESSTKGDLAKKYEISPEMISRWKKELVENASAAFEAKQMPMISTRSAMSSTEKSAS